MLTEYEVWAMAFLSKMLVERRNGVAICGEDRGVYEPPVIKAKKSGAMWLVVAQSLSTQVIVSSLREPQ